MGFESTYKELKLTPFQDNYIAIAVRFESTYKELKQFRPIYNIDFMGVLSLPIRNWNIFSMSFRS